MALGRSQSPAVPQRKAAKPARTASLALPEFVAPQLATLVTSPPEGDGWVHEIKYDGYRAIAAIAAGKVRIYTRSSQDWTAKFSSIANALKDLKVASALLDGEIVALDPEGRSSFQRLQNALRNERAPLIYYVFDILELDGRDVRAKPLERRKEILRKVLNGAPDAIRYSEDVAGHGGEMLAKACNLGLEGIVSKQANKPYVSRR